MPEKAPSVGNFSNSTVSYFLERRRSSSLMGHPSPPPNPVALQEHCTPAPLRLQRCSLCGEGLSIKYVRGIVILWSIRAVGNPRQSIWAGSWLAVVQPPFWSPRAPVPGQGTKGVGGQLLAKPPTHGVTFTVCWVAEGGVQAFGCYLNSKFSFYQYCKEFRKKRQQQAKR